VLDEATSSLDVPTERAVQDALETVLTDRTALIIAHRLSTVLIADRVLVIDDGRVVEDGSPEELVADAGRFADLHQHGWSRWPDPVLGPVADGGRVERLQSGEQQGDPGDHDAAHHAVRHHRHTGVLLASHTTGKAQRDDHVGDQGQPVAGRAQRQRQRDHHQQHQCRAEAVTVRPVAHGVASAGRSCSSVDGSVASSWSGTTT